MKIDKLNQAYVSSDQTVENNRQMAKTAGSVSYQAKKVLNENEVIQNKVIEEVSRPADRPAINMFSSILKKLNII